MAPTEKLAIDGGEPAVQHKLPPMYPGGLRIGAEEEQAVLAVLRSKRLFRYYGPEKGSSQVEAFEQAFAQRVGAQHAIAVSSGTAALMCGLAGLGVGPGDEVIVPAYTWIATASAVVAMGAVPIIAEIDESLTLDPTDVERKVTAATRAIAAVHMRGAPCNMAALGEIARRHKLAILEDAAQACGGSFKGKLLGAIGDVGAFSLQFNKIITSGEGGVVVANDEAVWRRALMYHDVVGGMRNGIPAEEVLPGINCRMAELQGAVALAQLGRLERLLSDMRRNKAVLKASIAEIARERGIQMRAIHDEQGDAAIALVFFAHNAQQAERIAEALGAEGVGASTLYSPDDVDYHVYRHWAPIMQQRSWSAQGGPWRWATNAIQYEPDMCPRSLDLLGRAVHLNVSPELNADDLEDIAHGINKVLAALG